jgi:phosphoglycolate phosphatase
MPLRAVIFDWDGTLLDSWHADVAAYIEMFRALGIDWGEDELRRHYSPDWHRVYRAAGLARERWDDADRLWRNFYARERPQLLPGARRTLVLLRRRYRLALVTSGNRARVSRQLCEFGFTGWFAACVFAEDSHRRKPHAAPLERALARLRLRPQECVFVGDAPEDVEMARRARVRAVAVLGPFPTHERLRTARADALLDSIYALPAALNRIAI